MPKRKLGDVNALPAYDVTDPQVILDSLPPMEHEEFLRQYHRAVEAAYDPAGYRHLQRLLHAWRLTAVAVNQPGYYEELEAARAGRLATVPACEAFPGL